MLFLVGQMMVGSSALLQLFHVFLGLEAWTKLEPGQTLAALEFRLLAWTAVVVVLAIAALSVSRTPRPSTLR